MSTQFETLGQALEAFPKRRFQVLAAPQLMEPVPNLRLTATVVRVEEREGLAEGTLYVGWEEKGV